MNRNYWIISDTHFGHKKLVELANRPKNFEEKIIKNIIHCIKPNDICIHLGDICIGNDEYWNSYITSIIPCKKWLTIGNHDKKSINKYLDYGWKFVSESFSIELFGHNILFSHKPQLDNGYSINIHGHLHDDNHRYNEVKDVLNDKQFLIAMERTNYAPLNLKSIIENISK